MKQLLDQVRIVASRLLWVFRLRPWRATVALTAGGYFLGCWIYYRHREGWTHPANWWFHLEESSQAAWIGSVGTVLAVWWAVFLYQQDIRMRERMVRRDALVHATSLAEELRKARAFFVGLNLGEGTANEMRLRAKFAKAYPVENLTVTNAALLAPSLFDLHLMEELLGTKAAIDAYNLGQQNLSLSSTPTLSETTPRVLESLAQRAIVGLDAALAVLSQSYLSRRGRELDPAPTKEVGQA